MISLHTTTSRYLLGGAIALLAFTPALPAATIVDLPSSGFSSSGSFVGVTGSSTEYQVIGGMTGSSANRISPSSTAFSTSEVFYGAFEGSFNTLTIYHPTINSNTANFIELRSRGGDIAGTNFPGGTTPQAGGFGGFLMWKSQDFLTNNTTFDSTSRITFNVGALASTSARYLINIGSNYYVSQTTITSTGAKNSGDLTAMTWLNYDPTADLFFSSGTTANIVTGGQIANISGVGFYVGTTSGAGANAFRFNDLEITAVPEPASMALTSLVALTLIARCRRRNAK